MSDKREIPLVGIVPAYSMHTDYNFHWDSLMMPIGPGYYLFEHSLELCACMGVDIIYVVGNIFVQKMVERQFGKYVIDPYTIIQNYDEMKRYFKHIKSSNDLQSFFLRKKSRMDLIPVLFMPIFVPYRTKLPLQNQLLSTMYASYLIGDSFVSISNTYKNVRFLAAFPQSMTPVSGFFHNFDTLAQFQKYREHFRENGNIYWTTQDKNIFAGNLMGFSFESQDIEPYRNALFGEMDKSSRSKKKADISVEGVMSRWGIKEKMLACPVDYAYDLSTWDGYESYIKTQKEKKDLISLGVPVKYPSEFRIGIGFDEAKNKRFGEHALMAASFDKLFGGI